MTRPQINFRLDTELLAAIKAKCEADGISITDFLTNAARSALGMERMERTTYPSFDALDSLTARIAEMDERLARCLGYGEKIEQIESRVEKVLGETAA